MGDLQHPMFYSSLKSAFLLPLLFSNEVEIELGIHCWNRNRWQRSVECSKHRGQGIIIDLVSNKMLSTRMINLFNSNRKVRIIIRYKRSNSCRQSDSLGKLMSLRDKENSISCLSLYGQLLISSLPGYNIHQHKKTCRGTSRRIAKSSSPTSRLSPWRWG